MRLRPPSVEKRALGQRSCNCSIRSNLRAHFVSCMKSKPRVASTRLGWLPVLSAPPTLEWESRLRGMPAVPLLGKAEKVQLEELILQKFQAHYDVHGAGSLLVDGT